MPSKPAIRAQQHDAHRQRMKAEGTPPASGAGSRPRWTPDEDAAITADDRPDIVTLSKQLGRTVDAIHVRRSRLLRPPVTERTTT
jgi:hypothetical protein